MSRTSRAALACRRSYRPSARLSAAIPPRRTRSRWCRGPLWIRDRLGAKAAFLVVCQFAQVAAPRPFERSQALRVAVPGELQRLAERIGAGACFFADGRGGRHAPQPVVDQIEEIEAAPDE